MRIYVYTYTTMYLCALVIILILLIILTSSRISGVSGTLGTSEHYQGSRGSRGSSGSTGSGIPTGNTVTADYCPYRALIGRWRTVPPNSIPAVSKEYEFSTLADGKTILLRVRHIMSGPGYAGNSGTSIFTRGACVLTNFKCQNGFAGDVTVEAQCVSSTPAYYQAPLDELPRKFNVIVNSKETLLIDVQSQEEFHKV